MGVWSACELDSGRGSGSKVMHVTIVLLVTFVAAALYARWQMKYNSLKCTNEKVKCLNKNLLIITPINHNSDGWSSANSYHTISYNRTNLDRSTMNRLRLTIVCTYLCTVFICYSRKF